MNKPSWLDNKMATVFGVIFFAPYVIFAYRLNKYTLDGQPMSGGRLFWRQYGWALLSAIPFFGLIYGLVNLNNIVETRNKVWELTNNTQSSYQAAAAPPAYAPPPDQM